MRKIVYTLLAAAVLATTPLSAADEKKAPAKQEQAKTVPAKAKDPICGMEVDTKTADKAEYKGKTYYFCSRDEKAEFQKNPAKYAK